MSEPEAGPVVELQGTAAGRIVADDEAMRAAVPRMAQMTQMLAEVGSTMDRADWGSAVGRARAMDELTARTGEVHREMMAGLDAFKRATEALAEGRTLSADVMRQLQEAAEDAAASQAQAAAAATSGTTGGAR